MKILQLCHKPPLPLVDGGCIAIHNITEGLMANGQDVKVVAIETPKHPVKMDAFSKDYLQKTRFESIFIDTSIHLKDGIKAVLKRKSYQISRFYSKSMASKLIQILKHEQFDIIHLESIYVLPYLELLRKYSNAKIVIRLHNIEHQIWERLSSNEHWPIRKLIYKINAKQLEQVEKKVLTRLDGYMAISAPDYEFFHLTAPDVPGSIITFGLDMEKYENEDDYIPSAEPSLCHIGSMNWSPNVEGIEWFLDEVWPLVQETHPEISFTLAGHNIPEKFFNRHDANVKIAGTVPNANEFLLSHDIMIVPLLSGSGIRIKIIEAMALGKVVVTTSVGAEGLDIVDGKHLFIANSPDEFLAVINKCIATPDLCTIIGENARDFISVNHNNDVITEQIIDFYKKVIG